VGGTARMNPATPSPIRAHLDAMSLPVGFHRSSDERLQDALRSYSDELGALEGLIAGKLDLLKCYDVAAMERVVAICFWGRSGSHLLASYLDGHDELVLMPENRGEAIYEFWQKFPGLTLWEKLVAYPTFVLSKKWGPGADFFSGDYAIGAAHYYAAVHALFAVYGDRSAEWLGERRRFLQFAHVAYALAAGRRVAGPRPLIIFAQHWPDEQVAQLFIEDFPEGRFIHTVRDPISTFDSWFNRQVDVQKTVRGNRLDLALRYVNPATETFRWLVLWDHSHAGMQARTRALRFEDLHVALEATMRRVADWLGVAFRPSMLESTFNGVPFVWKSDGVAWVGANPANAQRRSQNLSKLDRWLMFALLRQNFMEWGYPMPRIFRFRVPCMFIVAGLLWLPMKIERVTARMIIGCQALPALHNGHIGFGCRAPYVLLKLRLLMMRMLAGETRTRLIRGKKILQLL
jgi:hypothetical protein